MHATMFIAGLVALLAVAALMVPLAGEAQQPASLPRIGFLAPSSPEDARVALYLQAFRQGLRELGYVEGRSIAIEFRWAGAQYDRLPDLAAELVRLQVNLIVAGGPPAIQAAKHTTATIPIVMAAVADPVATGFVASLARPGGNITGISNMLPELSGSSWSCSRRPFPRSLGWPSSGIRPIRTTHRSTSPSAIRVGRLPAMSRLQVRPIQALEVGSRGIGAALRTASPPPTTRTCQ
jgi:hypothetical protein